MKKRVPKLILNAFEAAAWEAVVSTGYLSLLEAARVAGEIEDYVIFAAGRLRGGKAVVKRGQTPRESIANLSHDLERAVGVTPVRVRGWHGLRRQLSDYYALPLKCGKKEQDSDELLEGAATARAPRPGMDTPVGPPDQISP